MPPVYVFQRRAVSGGRVAGSGCGLRASSRAHGRSLHLRFARRDGAFALRFGVAVESCAALPMARAKNECGRLHPAARAGQAVGQAFRFSGELGPNRAVNRTPAGVAFLGRRFVGAGYLTR